MAALTERRRGWTGRAATAAVLRITGERSTRATAGRRSTRTNAGAGAARLARATRDGAAPTVCRITLRERALFPAARFVRSWADAGTVDAGLCRAARDPAAAAVRRIRPRVGAGRAAELLPRTADQRIRLPAVARSPLADGRRQAIRAVRTEIQLRSSAADRCQCQQAGERQNRAPQARPKPSPSRSAHDFSDWRTRHLRS